MNKTIWMLVAVVLSMVLASCDKTETFDDYWRKSNEEQFAKIAADPAYTKLESLSGEGFVMYKVLKSGEGKTPLYTDKVKVLYTGWYRNDWAKPDTYTGEMGNVINNKRVFDSTADRDNVASEFVASGVVDGFSTALQHMKEGDKWEVWMPWNLAYGAQGSGYSANSIKGYTTLVFEIELLEVLDK